MTAITRRALQIIGWLERFGAPLMDLVVRLWIARVFFGSGRQKIMDWESTVTLFEYEYAVPLLSPEVAAYLATFCELTMPVLLAIGLGARLAALPLLGMTLVIQFVLGAANPSYDNAEHYYWMILLMLIVVRGPGLYSVDHYIRQRKASVTLAA